MAKTTKEETSLGWDDFDQESLDSNPDDTLENLTDEEDKDKEPEEVVAVPKKVVKPKPAAAAPVVETEEIEEPVAPVPDATKDAEQDETPDSYKFFEEVQKITGEELDVDYGDVDPLTPQGVAIREKAVKQAALDGFLEEIEANYPAAYKALTHAYNGGDIADLFKGITTRDYSKVVLGEDDTATAKEILKEYYESKGIKNPGRIAKLIESAEDSGLVEEANAVLEELKASQSEAEATVLATQRAKAEQQKKQDSLIIGALDEILESGKLDTFKIGGPRETAEFRAFVKAGLRRGSEEGKYEFATPIDARNLEKLLKYKFFEFKNGDLSKLIQIKATTENAQKLRLRLSAEAARPKTSAASGGQASLSLNDFNEE